MRGTRRYGRVVIVEERTTTWGMVLMLLIMLHLVVDIAVGRVSSGQAVSRLTLEQDQLWSCRVVKDALKVHCIMNLILGLKNLLELEVVMTVSECIKVNISIVLPIH